MKMPARRSVAPGDPINEATIAALNRVIKPLIELMLDAGVTIQEFNKLVREGAVRVAMKRLMQEGSKEGKSRAAIMTGLPRSEVAQAARPRCLPIPTMPGLRGTATAKRAGF